MNPIPQILTDPDEIAALNARVLAENEAKERARVAAENRAAGRREPKAGDRLYVESRRGQRARAGLIFHEGRRREIMVVSEDDTVGQDQVRVYGAETILADPGLVSGSQQATEVEASGLRSKLAEKEAENEKLRAELARLQRDARMGAQDDGRGGPARLRAAQKARAGAAVPTDDAGFGGDQ